MKRQSLAVVLSIAAASSDAAVLFQYEPGEYAVMPARGTYVAGGPGGYFYLPFSLDAGFTAKDEVAFGIDGLTGLLDPTNLLPGVTRNSGTPVPTVISYPEPVRADWFAFSVTNYPSGLINFASASRIKRMQVQAFDPDGAPLAPAIGFSGSRFPSLDPQPSAVFDVVTPTEQADAAFAAAFETCSNADGPFTRGFCISFARVRTGAITGDRADQVDACFADPTGYTRPEWGSGFGFGGGGNGAPRCVRALESGREGGTSISVDDWRQPDQTDDCANVQCIVEGGFVRPGMEIGSIEFFGPSNVISYLIAAGNLTDAGTAFYDPLLSPPVPAIPLPAPLLLLGSALLGLAGLQRRSQRG